MHDVDKIKIVLSRTMPFLLRWRWRVYGFIRLCRLKKNAKNDEFIEIIFFDQKYRKIVVNFLDNLKTRFVTYFGNFFFLEIY